MAGRGSSFQGLFLRHGVAAGWCALAVLVGTAAAQPAAKGRPKANPEVKKLDSKMEKVKDSFLKDTEQLIKSYEDAGSYDRARTILEALQKLYPQNEPIKAKLEKLAAQSLDASEIDFDLDAGKSWQEVGPVGKDRTIRIRVSGDYKLTTAPLTTGQIVLAVHQRQWSPAASGASGCSAARTASISSASNCLTRAGVVTQRFTYGGWTMMISMSSTSRNAHLVLAVRRAAAT